MFGIFLAVRELCVLFVLLKICMIYCLSFFVFTRDSILFNLNPVIILIFFVFFLPSPKGGAFNILI